MKLVKLLKAEVINCCRNRDCQKCGGKGYYVIDHSYYAPVDEEPQQSKAALRKQRLYEERRANCQCVKCGNPNLASETLCAECLTTSNEATARAKRDARNSTSPI